MVKVFYTLLKILGIIYVILCVSLFFIQEKLIFNGSPLSDQEQFGNAEEVYTQVSPDVKLHSLHLRENQTSQNKGVILYLHGNRGNNKWCFRQARQFLGLGYDVFMPDYRGYGKSEGTIGSERQLFADVEKIYQVLLKEYKEKDIKILGFSLGTGMATYLAANHDPQELVLVAPFISLVAIKKDRVPIIPSFILKYPFRNDRYLKQVDCPVTLLHGTEDDVIPFENSVSLEKMDPEKIKLVRLNGVSHRGSIFQNEVRKAVRD